MPNLYWRDAPGASPDDAAATARAKGGVPDDRLVGDVAGAMAYLKNLSNSNGKVGMIGYCSGGRQSFLAAVSLQLDAAVDCYGAFVTGEAREGTTMVPIVDKTPTCPARCSACSATTTSTRRPRTWTSSRRRSRPTARTTSSTATRRRARVLLGEPPGLPARGRDRRLAEDLRLLRPVPLGLNPPPKLSATPSTGSRSCRLRQLTGSLGPCRLRQRPPLSVSLA